jgi:hypothetical protein
VFHHGTGGRPLPAPARPRLTPAPEIRGFLHADPPADGAALRRRVDAAFQEENAVRPLDALNGLTPDEAYFGWPTRVPASAPRYAAERVAARALRRSTNPGLACGACDPEPVGPKRAPP